MLLYNAIFSFLLFIRYGIKLGHKQRRQLYPLILLPLFIFSAFRLEVGCDWTGYLNQFEMQRQLTFNDALQHSDPLWWSLIYLTHLLGLPYPWLNVFSSLIAFWGIHRFARRQPDPLGFLVLLFPILIINMPMSGIRQGAAIGIMCIAFGAFIDKKMIKFILFTLIASSIHSSTILFLLLAPLVTGDYSRKRLFLAGLLAVPGLLALMGLSSAEEAQRRYIDSDYDAAGAIFRVGLLVATGLFFFKVLRRKWLITFPDDYKLAIIGSTMFIATLLILPVSSIISDRLGYYLIPIQIMILTRMIYLPLKTNKTFYTRLSYFGFFAVFLIWTYYSQLFTMCYVPYDSWLFGLPQTYKLGTY